MQVAQLLVVFIGLTQSVKLILHFYRCKWAFKVLVIVSELSLKVATLRLDLSFDIRRIFLKISLLEDK